MPIDQVCWQCNSSQLQRSSIHNLWELLMSALFVVYRCQSCYTRQLKLRFIPIGIDAASHKPRISRT